MEIDIYQVDAFTKDTFGGNSACVCPLDSWLEDKVLQKIAMENAVAETAFFVLNKDDSFEIRWFTPEIEMDLCGHATLATAHVIARHLNYEESKIRFTSRSGDLIVELDDRFIHLDFPARIAQHAQLPKIVFDALSVKPIEVYKSRDYVLVYENEEQIKDIKVNRNIFDEINLDPGGVIVTAKGNEVDFVSRFFTPNSSILEDPVTGSAHCSLIPFWSKRLEKNKLKAIQLSSRVGYLYCEDRNERVIISGEAVTYMKGTIFI